MRHNKTRLQQLDDLLLFEVEKLRSNYKSFSMCLDDDNLRQAGMAIINMRFTLNNIAEYTSEAKSILSTEIKIRNENEVQTKPPQQAQ